MTLDDLPAILIRGESERVEFKTSLAESKCILETVAAMATLGGGTIVVGVRDDGSVVGIDLGEGALEQLSQRILAGTDPKVYVRLRTVPVDDRPVLSIDVASGDGPHLADGRAFTPSSPATLLMSRDEYARRLLDRLGESAGYERQIVRDVLLDTLDRTAMSGFVARAGPRGVVWDGDPASLLDRLHLLREGRPTVSTAPTQVRLDDEKLGVWSPGHLPEPLTVSALRRAHPSVPPNPRIARALYLAGLVEVWGTVTLRVVSSMGRSRAMRTRSSRPRSAGSP